MRHMQRILHNSHLFFFNDYIHRRKADSEPRSVLNTCTDYLIHLLCRKPVTPAIKNHMFYRLSQSGAPRLSSNQ